ncbi:hypothetical protein [Sphingobacterium sp.]|uniref:hypothetical protein n=1 Tax=Sphingobacterium sp. TaxID=341027 RepID=UPI0031D45FC9
MALIFLGVFILYAIGVALFISKGDEKTIGAFEAITGISGLILSFGTVYYVVKTYQAQKQQIGVQKIQIKIQQDEIFANKKDLEFNRTLDIVYKQLEYTNKIFEKLEDSYYTKLRGVDDLTYIFNCTHHFNHIFGQMIEQINFYIKIIDKDIFQLQDRRILHQILSACINQNIIELYTKFNLALGYNYDFEDLKKQFSE